MSNKRSRVAVANLIVEVSNLDLNDGDAVILVWQQRTRDRSWPDLLDPDRVVRLCACGRTAMHVFNNIDCGHYAIFAFQVTKHPASAPVQIARVGARRIGSSTSINPLDVLDDVSLARFRLTNSQHVTIQLRPIAGLWEQD